MNTEKRTTNDIKREADLVCEALVREINRADRWSAVVDAWQALLHVRNMAKGMTGDSERLNQCGCVANWEKGMK